MFWLNIYIFCFINGCWIHAIVQYLLNFIFLEALIRSILPNSREVIGFKSSLKMRPVTNINILLRVTFIVNSIPSLLSHVLSLLVESRQLWNRFIFTLLYKKCCFCTFSSMICFRLLLLFFFYFSLKLFTVLLRFCFKLVNVPHLMPAKIYLCKINLGNVNTKL